MSEGPFGLDKRCHRVFSPGWGDATAFTYIYVYIYIKIPQRCSVIRPTFHGTSCIQATAMPGLVVVLAAAVAAVAAGAAVAVPLSAVSAGREGWYPVHLDVFEYREFTGGITVFSSQKPPLFVGKIW